MNSSKAASPYCGDPICALLANVGAGVVELIPDNNPVAGNLDEFIASLILIRFLA